MAAGTPTMIFRDEMEYSVGKEKESGRRKEKKIRMSFAQSFRRAQHTKAITTWVVMKGK